MPADYATLDDPQLIDRIASGDHQALQALYDRYARLVFSLALRVIDNSSTAEEITLDVFLRIWQKAHTYDPRKAQVNTWLTSITRYRAIDALRRRSARPQTVNIDWVDLTSDSHPEQAAGQALRSERLRQALNDLPAAQRQALALAYYSGYTHRQIAEHLDQPLGTIKTRIRLAMKKLRQHLQEHDDE